MKTKPSAQYGRASQLLDPSRGCKMPSTKELAASVGTATVLVVGDLVGSNFPHVGSRADNASHCPDARASQWQPFYDWEVVEWICEA
jgi:hypothetical protein